LGVIEPGAEAARAASRTGDVLVIATEATVHSHAYAAACRAQGLRALEKACPLLVPLVEEGWTDHPVTAEVIRIYLDELTAEAAFQGLKPDTLVLGCTHYPLLRPLLESVIASCVPGGMKVIDSAEAVAEAAVRQFGAIGWPAAHGLPSAAEDDRESNPQSPPDFALSFFATDSVEKFERLGSRFLGRGVGSVKLVDLGG
jgi:glutamate racemase